MGVKEEIDSLSSVPVITKRGDQYVFDYDRPQSIGRVKPFYGNFGVNVRAYTYIRSMGPDGLKAVGEYAVLNANYMMRRLGAVL